MTTTPNPNTAGLERILAAVDNLPTQTLVDADGDTWEYVHNDDADREVYAFSPRRDWSTSLRLDRATLEAEYGPLTDTDGNPA